MLTVFVARCWTLLRLVSPNATIGVDDCLKVTYALGAWSTTMFGWAYAELLFRRPRHLITSSTSLSVRITWSRVTTESITLKKDIKIIKKLTWFLLFDDCFINDFPLRLGRLLILEPDWLWSKIRPKQLTIPNLTNRLHLLSIELALIQFCFQACLRLFFQVIEFILWLLLEMIEFIYFVDEFTFIQ